MKRLLFALLAIWTLAVSAQPILRNTYTTNSIGRTPNLLATDTNTLFPLMVLNPDGSGSPRSILFNEAMKITGTNTTLGGNLSLNARTNLLSISAGGQLLLDGSPITGGGDTLWTNSAGVLQPDPTPQFGVDLTWDISQGDSTEGFFNINAIASSTATNRGVISMFVNAATGNPSANLSVSANGPDGDLELVDFFAGPGATYLSVSSISTNILTATVPAITTDLVLSLQGQTNQIGDNGTSLTYNGVPIGGVTTAVTPLAYSGTNITGFNCTTNNMTYTLTLTNHALFGTSTFADLPNTTTNKFFTLGLKQDGTGTWVPKFTNTVVAWADGVEVVVSTNANSLTYLYFHSHLFTNGMLVGSANVNVR